MAATVQAVKRHQVEIEVIPEDSEGDIDVEALEKAVVDGARKPALIAITHIPTSSGTLFCHDCQHLSAL